MQQFFQVQLFQKNIYVSSNSSFYKKHLSSSRKVTLHAVNEGRNSCPGSSLKDYLSIPRTDVSKASVTGEAFSD
jgi:hypothetical protein